jgi:hypothetical protein
VQIGSTLEDAFRFLDDSSSQEGGRRGLQRARSFPPGRMCTILPPASGTDGSKEESARRAELILSLPVPRDALQVAHSNGSGTVGKEGVGSPAHASARGSAGSAQAAVTTARTEKSRSASCDRRTKLDKTSVIEIFTAKAKYSKSGTRNIR